MGELANVQSTRDITQLRFRPEAALKRVAATGDLFAPLLTLKQSLPAKLLPTDTSNPKSARDSRPAMRSRQALDHGLSGLPKAGANFIPPMLLLRTERLPEGASWLYELLCGGPHNAEHNAEHF